MCGSTTQSIVRVLSVVALVLGLAGAVQAVQPNPSGKQAGKFVVLGTGDVLDTTTSLRWQQTPGTPGLVVSPCDNGNTCTWTEATAYCVARGEGSRLPEVKELHSLIDYSQFAPALPEGHPFGIVQPPEGYWSATTIVDNPTNAWFVDFLNGFVLNGNKGAGVSHAWCVR